MITEQTQEWALEILTIAPKRNTKAIKDAMGIGTRQAGDIVRALVKLGKVEVIGRGKLEVVK